MRKEISAAVGRARLITMRTKRGMHTDVYEDFEADLLKYTAWKAVKGSVNILERVFEKYFLPRLKYRTFPFDLPGPKRNRILFAALSGIEYIKIFQHYVFQSKLKVIYQFDSWTHDNAVNANAFRSFKINIAFLSIREAADYFNSLKMPDFEAYWIPEAISSSGYRWNDYSMKDIDLLQYGRRWEWLHAQLLGHCLHNKIHYEYPQDPGNVKRQFRDRKSLLDGLSRSRIAVCVPKTMTHSEYHLSTVTARYFECMSSKCLIWGHAPPDLVSLFGYNPVVEVDHSEPRRQLKYMLEHYAEFIPLIEKNYETAKEKHQWKNRIDEMKHIIGKNIRFQAAP